MVDEDSRRTGDEDDVNLRYVGSGGSRQDLVDSVRIFHSESVVLISGIVEVYRDRVSLVRYDSVRCEDIVRYSGDCAVETLFFGENVELPILDFGGRSHEDAGCVSCYSSQNDC